MHVYSLQPTVLQDLNALTDASRELSTTYASQDPLEFGKQWGMIQNSHVKVSDSFYSAYSRMMLTNLSEETGRQLLQRQ